MVEQSVCGQITITVKAFASEIVYFHNVVGYSGTFSALCSFSKCTLYTFSGKSSLQIVHIFHFWVEEVLGGGGPVAAAVGLE